MPANEARASQAGVSEHVRRLRALDCCTLSDALDRLGLDGVVAGLLQRSGGRIAGRAVTVKLGVGAPQPGPPRHLCAAAVEMASADDVIVIEQRTGIDAGSWGGLLTLAARLRSVAGVVADGPVRDIEEAQARGFPIYARSLTARTARGRIVEQATNAPVSIGDRLVEPGDYVTADQSAVVFIRAGDIARVLDAAEAIAAREAEMAQALFSGTPVGEVMGSAYEHLLKR